MVEHFVQVSGHVVRPTNAGSNWFLNVRNTPWTDVTGFSLQEGTIYKGRQGKSVYFHFPITTPTILSGVRLKCNLVALTLSLEPTNAFLKEIQVSDRLNTFFTSKSVAPNLNVSEDLRDVARMNQNMFAFDDHLVNAHICVSALIFFKSDSEVHFAGAGVRLHD